MYQQEKRKNYVPYSRFFALLLAHVGMGYNINHGTSIPTPVLSSVIINVDHVDRHPHLSDPMMDWIENTYLVKEPQENLK